MATLVPNSTPISQVPCPVLGSPALLGCPDALLRVSTPGSEDRLVPVQGNAISIGGAPQCRLRISEPGVRPLHCLVRQTAEGLRVWRWAKETTLNGAEFIESPFELGDELTVGSARIQLTRPNEVEPAPEVHGFLEAGLNETTPADERLPTESEPIGALPSIEVPPPLEVPAPPSTERAPAVRLGRITPVLPVPEYLLRPWSESPLVEGDPAPPVSTLNSIAEETVAAPERDFAGPPEAESASLPVVNLVEEVEQRTNAVHAELLASRDRAIGSLRQRVRGLIAALRAEISLRTSAESVANAAQTELAGLNQQFNLLSGEIELLSGEVEHLRAEAVQWAGEEQTLKECTGRLESELKEALAQVEEAHAELTRLRLELATSQEDTQKAIQAATLAAEQLSLLASTTVSVAAEVSPEQEPATASSDPPAEFASEEVAGGVAPEPSLPAAEASISEPSNQDASPSEWDWSVTAEPAQAMESAVEPESDAASPSNATASTEAPASLAETVRRFNPSTDWWTTPAASAPAEAAQPESNQPESTQPEAGDAHQSSLAAPGLSTDWQSAPQEAVLPEAEVAPEAIGSFGEALSADEPSEPAEPATTGEELAELHQDAAPLSPAIEPYEEPAAVADQTGVQEQSESQHQIESNEQPATEPQPEGSAVASELPASELPAAEDPDQTGALDKLQAAIAALPAKPLFEPAPQPPQADAERPAAGPNTVSFIQRYAHLFAEEGADAPAPAPAPMPAPRAPAHQQAEEEVEPSIDDYMSQLLQRSRSGDSSISIKPVAAEPVEAKPAPPVEPVTPITSLDELQRTVAPERSTDMNVLRELANSSARQAIGVANQGRKEETRVVYLAISGLSIGVGGVLMFMASSFQSLTMEFGGGLVILGALGAIYTARGKRAATKLNDAEDDFIV